MSATKLPAAVLPARASSENLRKQAKALHKAFHAGQADAVERIRQHLPRAAAITAQSATDFDLSLQEAQHVLAREFGRANWDDLRAVVEVTFEAFADLPKADLQAVLRQIDQTDLVRALSDQPERVREAIYSCMSRRVVRSVNDEIIALDVTPGAAATAQQTMLDCARQVALEGGFEWPPQVVAATFEELSRLSDRDVQMVLREVSQADLARALIGASEGVRGRCLGNMSRRVRTFLIEEGERLADGLPAHEPEASRQRVVEWADALGQDARIIWPPSPDSQPWSGSLKEPGRATDVPSDLPGFDDLDLEGLTGLFEELSRAGRSEWLTVLERSVSHPRGLLGEGLRLAADGTEADKLTELLRTRTQTMLHNRRQQLLMMQQGVESLQAGTNPGLLLREMQAHYLDPDVWAPPKRSREQITGRTLFDWLERGWLSTRTREDIAELFMHLGFAARNEGIDVLTQAAEYVEPTLLRQALAAVAATRSTPEVLQARMSEQAEAEEADLGARLRAVTAGIASLLAAARNTD